MKKPIYIGKGLSEQLECFCEPKKFNKETIKYFLNGNYEPSTSNYFLMMGSKQYEMYTLLMAKENKQIDTNLADLKIKAIIENAYLYPGWNYLKYPQADLSCGYDKHSFTNEIFEEIDKDIYDDPILIFVGRERNL